MRTLGENDKVITPFRVYGNEDSSRRAPVWVERHFLSGSQCLPERRDHMFILPSPGLEDKSHRLPFALMLDIRYDDRRGDRTDHGRHI